MILYVDVFITDKALFPNKSLDKIEDEVRGSSTVYKYHNKLDVTKYSLASYAPYQWSKVIIKYDLETIYSEQEFELYCRSLFDNPIIIKGRSDCQKKFKESYELFKDIDDDFVFWAANNDHPMIVPGYDDLNAVIQSAKELSKKLKTTNISIDYSHFFESNYKYRNNSPVNFLKNGSDVILETELYFLVNFQKGYLDGIQIFHKDLFYKLFYSQSYGNQRIIRPESLKGKIEYEQYVVFPKFEICRHYDGYMHLELMQKPYVLKAKNIPPLFIPTGFFENKAYIKYGFSKYDTQAININALIDFYSFEDSKKKTDLKISIDKIPFFWRHIPIIKNEGVAEFNFKLASDLEYYRVLNLWDSSILKRLSYIFQSVIKRPSVLWKKASYLLKVLLNES